MAEHTHNKKDAWILAQKSGGFEEEFFCTKCARVIDECPYCRILQP